MSLRRSATRRAQAGSDAAGPKQKRGLADVQQGIKQLHPEPGSGKDRETDIDIVFVPGLGAHPIESWRSGTTKFNWAVDKEGIIKDFPNARVLLYMYESAWMGGFKVKQFLSNLASTLLDGLDGIRNDSKKSNPIVFIGHSMGGLVIAKAICIVESRKNVYPGLFEDITGCAVFGTPFKGAQAASMAVMLSYIGEKMDKAEPSKLLELMRPDDEGLNELRRDFVRAVGELHPKISLFGFWEEHKTKFSDLGPVPDFIKRLGIPLPKNLAEFVTRDSAILDCMDSMGLAANHRDLVKFESSKDLRYALVRSPLKRLINGAALVVRNRRKSTRPIDWDLFNKAMDALDGARVWKKRDEIDKKTTPSSWIPDESEYVGWLSKDGGTLIPQPQGAEPLKQGECLWIRGPDGRGKTSATLAALKGIDHMIQTGADKPSVPILLAYFLCDSTPDYGTAEELVKSLVWQLIRRDEYLASHAEFLVGKTDKVKHKVQPLLTVENLWQVLQDILADKTLSDTSIYLVINNLEALPDTGSTSTLLSLLNAEVENMVGRHAKVRWMITSGESYRIGQALKGEALRLIDLEDEKYSDQVQLELRNHAAEKVSALVKEKDYSKALAYFVSSLIGKRAQNTQWIDITCVHLQELPHKTDLQVRLQLEVVPQELDALLNFAWQQVFDANRGRVAEIKEMLRVLVLTQEDPTEQELALLAGLDSPAEQTELHDLVSKCKPLLSIKPTARSETTVCFIDAVVKRHLLENARRMLGLSEEDIKLQHGMLGLRAFGHVMKALKDLGTTEPGEGDDEGQNDQFSDDESDGEDDQDGDGDDDSEEEEEEEDEDSEAPEIKDKAHAYAVKYWLHHASQATTDIADDLSRETEFWKKDSDIRRRWLTEHHRLTDSFKNWERIELTGLHVASAIGFRGLVGALLKNGYDHEKNMRDSLCYTPLHFAAAFGQTDIIEELLNKGAAIDDGKEDDHQTPLHQAAAKGNVKAMVMLLQRGADPNASCDTFGRVINAAVDSGNCEAVKVLVEKDVSLEGEDSEEEEDDEAEGENKQPGDEAEDDNEDEDDDNEDDDDDEEEDDEEEDEDEDDEEEFIRSPLALAALRSDLTMFEFLIKNYSEKLPPKEFNKALIKAVESGRLEAFNHLFDSYEHPQETFQEALEGAAYEEKWDIVAILLEKRPGLNCDQPFLNAAEGDDGDQAIRSIEAMWEYTNGSISAEQLDKSLYQATDFQNEKTVQLLLRFGASPDATGEEYGNALTAAAYDGTKDIVNMLLDAKADINSPNGWALQTAAGEGHMEIVELLLKRGADVNALTTNDNMSSGTAIQAAVEAGNEDIVTLLLEHGADPNLGGGSLTCPIIAAANNGEKEILQRLINAKADVNRLGGEYNSTPLTYAAMYLPQESLRSILDAGADINFADNDGDTPLILAARAPDAESVQFLLDRGADVLLRNNSNDNALDVAVGTGDIDCITTVAKHVSAIMEALSVAMEGGDAAVTAVVRSVENRKQELNYDEPIPEEDEDEDEDEEEKEEEETHETTEPVAELEAAAAVGGENEQVSSRPASEVKSFDSTSTLVPEEAGGSGSQTPDSAAGLRNSYQPPQAGFAPIRRKPITVARPAPYRPYQPPGDVTQQPGSEQSQFFAYRPGVQPEAGAPGPQQLPEQAPQWPPNPAGAADQVPGFDRKDRRSSFFGMKTPWSGDRYS